MEQYTKMFGMKNKDKFIEKDGYNILQYPLESTYYDVDLKRDIPFVVFGNPISTFKHYLESREFHNINKQNILFDAFVHVYKNHGAEREIQTKKCTNQSIFMLTRYLLNLNDAIYSLWDEFYSARCKVCQSVIGKGIIIPIMNSQKSHVIVDIYCPCCVISNKYCLICHQITNSSYNIIDYNILSVCEDCIEPIIQRFYKYINDKAPDKYSLKINKVSESHSSSQEEQENSSTHELEQQTPSFSFHTPSLNSITTTLSQCSPSSPLLESFKLSPNSKSPILNDNTSKLPTQTSPEIKKKVSYLQQKRKFNDNIMVERIIEHQHTTRTYYRACPTLKDTTQFLTPKRKAIKLLHN